MFSFKECL
jgi:hypothetical protein